VCFRPKNIERRLNVPENRFQTPVYFGDYGGVFLSDGGRILISILPPAGPTWARPMLANANGGCT
jgi:hypothetical protein